MKRVRCPKCDNYITFDENKYKEGQSLVFQCPQCGKQFGIRIGVSKLRNTQKEDNPEENADGNKYGYINHCSITVSKNKNGKLKYILKDGPSYTGTFVDNVILGDREQRLIEDGTLFTIGATSVILHTPDGEEE